MQVTDAIAGRRSVNRLTDRIPGRAEIEKMIEAATWAPNHRFTQPWRFHVIAGEDRQRFGEHLAEAKLGRCPPQSDADRAALKKTAGLFLRAPLVIAVSVARSTDRVQDLEDYGAACAAIQNMLVGSLGDGDRLQMAHWRCGPGPGRARLSRAPGPTIASLDTFTWVIRPPDLSRRRANATLT